MCVTKYQVHTLVKLNIEHVKVCAPVCPCPCGQSGAEEKCVIPRVQHGVRFVAVCDINDNNG